MLRQSTTIPRQIERVEFELSIIKDITCLRCTRARYSALEALRKGRVPRHRHRYWLLTPTPTSSRAYRCRCRCRCRGMRPLPNCRILRPRRIYHRVPPATQPSVGVWRRRRHHVIVNVFPVSPPELPLLWCGDNDRLQRLTGQAIIIRRHHACRALLRD